MQSSHTTTPPPPRPTRPTFSCHRARLQPFCSLCWWSVRSSRMMEIQTRMAERAIELLSLPPTSPPLHLLDIGCGSGLSGEAITEAGHYWTGIDISPAMLAVALLREVEGSLICHDIGQGLPFRAASFDGCISVSVLQWLCNADHKEHVPRRRLAAFFTSLFSSLKRGAKAVFQCYPETPAQLALMMEAAVKAGFTGGVVVDYPNSTKAKKYFLCLVGGRWRGGAERTDWRGGRRAGGGRKADGYGG